MLFIPQRLQSCRRQPADHQQHCRVYKKEMYSTIRTVEYMSTEESVSESDEGENTGQRTKVLVGKQTSVEERKSGRDISNT